MSLLFHPPIPPYSKREKHAYQNNGVVLMVIQFYFVLSALEYSELQNLNTHITAEKKKVFIKYISRLKESVAPQFSINRHPPLVNYITHTNQPTNQPATT